MKYLTIIFLFISIKTFGQTDSKKLQVYFSFDKYELEAKEKDKIDTLISDQEEILKIDLFGHTDNKGSTDYNLTLSKNRVKSIQQYLMLQGIKIDQIGIHFFGEDSPIKTNNTDDGRQKNRRVELIAYFAKKKIKDADHPLILKDTFTSSPMQEDSVTIKPIATAPLKKQIVKRDTVLIIDEVQIVISKKDFHKLKDCLVINPILDGEEAFRNNLTTMTVNNETLVSCGMIDIQLEKPCEGCFDKPIKVRFPVTKNECDPCRRRGVFNISRDGKWIFQPNDKIKKVRIEGKFYYEMIIKCPTRKNCDCKQDFQNIKFKLPRKYQLTYLNVIYNCPIANYKFKVNKNKANGRLPCLLADREAFVYFEAVNNRNDTIQVKNLKLTELKHSILKKCKKKQNDNKFIFFKDWKYKVYSKYRIKENDIKEY